MLAAGLIHHGVNILRTGMGDILHLAVFAAGFGIHHRAANDILNKIAALGQLYGIMRHIQRFAACSTGSIHILYALQRDQRQIALCAHTANVYRALALRIPIQRFGLGQKGGAVTIQLGLHFAAHAMGGHNAADLKIILHGVLLFDRKKGPLCKDKEPFGF